LGEGFPSLRSFPEEERERRVKKSRGKIYLFLSWIWFFHDISDFWMKDAAGSRPVVSVFCDQENVKHKAKL